MNPHTFCLSVEEDTVTFLQKDEKQTLFRCDFSGCLLHHKLHGDLPCISSVVSNVEKPGIRGKQANDFSVFENLTGGRFREIAPSPFSSLTHIV